MSYAAAIARLMDARTILLRTALTLNEGEARDRVLLASTVVRDALELCQTEAELAKTLGHLEVLADALAAPGNDAA